MQSRPLFGAWAAELRRHDNVVILPGGPKKWYLSYNVIYVREVSLFWPTLYVYTWIRHYTRRVIEFNCHIEHVIVVTSSKQFKTIGVARGGAAKPSPPPIVPEQKMSKKYRLFWASNSPPIVFFSIKDTRKCHFHSFVRPLTRSLMVLL